MSDSSQFSSDFSTQNQDQMFDFGQSIPSNIKNVQSTMNHFNGVRNTRVDQNAEMLNNVNKPLRHVTEIRVYYDDQTWESFVHAKK